MTNIYVVKNSTAGEIFHRGKFRRDEKTETRDIRRDIEKKKGSNAILLSFRVNTAIFRLHKHRKIQGNSV